MLVGAHNCKNGYVRAFDCEHTSQKHLTLEEYNNNIRKPKRLILQTKMAARVVTLLCS